MKTTSPTTPSLTRNDLLHPLLLVLLSIVPMVGGIARLATFTSDGATTPADVRFHQAPTPIVLHVIAATLYAVFGAFQFSAGLRRRWPGAHRSAGRVLALLGLTTAASGLWMTLFYDIPTYHQGPLLLVVRLLVGSAMIAAITLGISAIRRRDVQGHEAFMIRAYALAQGAGTQVLVLLPWMLLSGDSEGLTRDLLMTLSWILNLLFAEWIIGRRNRGAASCRVDAHVSRATLA